MPRLTQPEIASYELDWGNNTAQKLSGKTFVNPSGQTVDCNIVSVTCTVGLSALNKFIVTAVKDDGRNYGFYNDVLVDCEGSSPTGVKIVEYSDIAAGSTKTFQIRANYHFTAGEGVYRIGLYVQNNDGTWNFEYFFFTYGGTTQFETSDGKDFQVPVHTAIS